MNDEISSLQRLLTRLSLPLRRNVRDDEALLIALCAPFGALVGLSVVLLHEIVAQLHRLSFGVAIDQSLSGTIDIALWRLMLVPVSGGLLLGLLALWGRRVRPGEIVDPIEANALHGGRMSLIDSLRLATATAISNGVGASLGMEAAFTQLGAAILSLIGQRLRLRRADLRVFVAAGAAASIASAFNAPLAGAFYAFELVLGSYSPASLAQVAMASLAGTLVMRATIGTAPIFLLDAPRVVFQQWDYPMFALVGVGAAMVGIITMRSAVWCEGRMRQMGTADWLRPAFGGLALSALACVFPQILGSGHGAIRWLFDGTPILSYLVLLLVAKIAATAISIGSGFRGGLFSASLFLGCLFGDIVAGTGELLLPAIKYAHPVMMLVGMAAVAASVIGAPITMVLLVLEMTGDLQVALAVLAGVVLAATLTRFRFGYSFATWRFHQRGKAIRSGLDIGWLVDFKVGQILRADAKNVPLDMPLLKLREAIPLGSRSVIFAVDDADRYAGMIDVTLIHDSAYDDAAIGLVAADLAEQPGHYLLPETDIRTALSMFESWEAEILPVLADDQQLRVIGYISEAFALKRFAHEMERNHNSALGERDLFKIWPTK